MPPHPQEQQFPPPFHQKKPYLPFSSPKPVASTAYKTSRLSNDFRIQSLSPNKTKYNIQHMLSPKPPARAYLKAKVQLLNIMFKEWTNRKNLEIIALLRKNIFRGVPLAEIEKTLPLTHHPAYRRITQLERDGIVLKKEGNYRLDLKNPETVEALYFLSRQEKLEFIASFKNDLFRQLDRQFNGRSDIEFAIIFGSYARGEETKTSDLDIFLVSGKREINRSFEAMYNVKSSIIVATKGEFIKMLKDRKKIARDLFTEGIVLKGNIYEILAEHYAEW